MKIAELHSVASQLGMKGYSRLRKPELIEAISQQRAAIRAAAQATQSAPAAQAPQASAGTEAKKAPAQRSRAKAEPAKAESVKTQSAKAESAKQEPADAHQGGEQLQLPNIESEASQESAPRETQPTRARKPRHQSKNRAQRSTEPDRSEAEAKLATLDEIIKLPVGKESEKDAADRRRRAASAASEVVQGTAQQGGGQSAGQSSGGQTQSGQGGASHNSGDDDDSAKGRRRNRDRTRDRKRRAPNAKEDTAFDENELLEDDVLIPVAGVLDVLDNYAFVRTTGFLPGASDVYVSLGQVKKSNLRPGDAVTGSVRQPRPGEAQRQKFNALVRLDTVNGIPADKNEDRPEFAELAPVYAQDPLRLERGRNNLGLRTLDVVAPLAKGQRVLVISPPHSGRTTLIQEIGAAVSEHHPEVHLMVVVVDERPEDLTHLQRSIHGEVIATSFDHAPSEHVSVAELALERAKRLVELGQDVVVVLDSISSMSQAYQASASQSSRATSTTVETQSILGPKKFFGSARNVEHGGSLTIIAFAVQEVQETPAPILKELRRSANAEIVLLPQGAHAEIFPALDTVNSQAHGQEHYLSESDLTRRRNWQNVLRGADSHRGLQALGKAFKASINNNEALGKPLKISGGTSE